jgi:DNA-binding NtrC family response regulator
VVTLTQPPLRERIGDIPLLAAHYLAEFNQQSGKQLAGFDALALQLMQRYSWPGNVRELVNVVERAVVLTKGTIITIADLPESIREEDRWTTPMASIATGGSLKSAMQQPERQIILEALDTNGWNRQDTARMLGINRTTLYKKMKRYGIEYEPAGVR